MTTTSYPAVGTDGFTEDDWAEYFDGCDGIINDYAGTALALTRINAGEIARYSTGKVRVGGYVLEVTADHDLTVSTSAATYWTWACYDPALNVAGGGGAASADGPCTLGISSGLPSTTGGKQYVLLDKIVRAASQSLTAATLTSLRRWYSGAVEWEGTLTPESVESNYPRGTVRFDRTRGDVQVRTMNAANSAMEWRSLLAPTVAAFAYAAGLQANAIGGPAEYIRIGSRVYMQGTVRRTVGALSSGSETTLGTLPAGFRPAHPRIFVCVTNAGDLIGRVQVNTSGTVALLASTDATGYVDLSPINFQIA